MKKLIITEKNISARRIAYILSGGKFKVEKSYNLPIYVFKNGEDEYKCIGLKGHILKVDFPPQYQNWQKVNPKELINAGLIKVPIHKNILKLLQKEAKGVDEVIVATDFDREGELIGFDVVNEVKKVNPTVVVKRARFSTLTPGEIKSSFSHLEEPYLNLALAGGARQDIDLIWGATLTRFISLASSRLGKQFLSVGRVQSPTLCLVAQREREIREFKPKPYWQLKGLFQRESGEEFWAPHEKERFWNEDEVKALLEKLGKVGRVQSVEREERKISPPPPFNTTSFLAAASSLSISPARAMRIAENLYMNGFISYPRVDNTVYPKSLNLRGILKEISKIEDFSPYCEKLLAQKTLRATRGKKEATDHPPIYPTAVPERDKLGKDEAKIYELVVRRFLATLSPFALVEFSKITIDMDGEKFLLKGQVVKEEGWYQIYPYTRRKDEEVPDLEEGESLEVKDFQVERKETKPPPRYSQGKLVQEMERLGLGTKATRHQIIQNLYERGYIKGDPIRPTELGLAVAETLLQHMEPISSPQMTAELEEEMDRIAEGEKEKREVVEHSRSMLASVMNLLETKKKEVGHTIKAGLREERLVGECPLCGGELRVVRSKRSGKRFVGCSNYPKCKNSFPLPQNGELLLEGEVCSLCGSPKVKVLNRRRKPWEVCLNPDCPGKREVK
jgi:DNA topoisomerase-1